MNKLLALILLLAVLTSCNHDALKKEQTNNTQFEIELIFEKDGIKMYRFMDGGRYHYFTTKGETITEQKSGKTVYDENIK